MTTGYEEQFLCLPHCKGGFNVPPFLFFQGGGVVEGKSSKIQRERSEKCT